MLEIDAFNTIVADFRDVIGEKAAEIERQKLQAVGLRIQMDGNAEERDGKQFQILALINERQAELARLICFNLD